MLKKSEVLQEGYEKGLRFAQEKIREMLLKESPIFTDDMAAEEQFSGSPTKIGKLTFSLLDEAIGGRLDLHYYEKYLGEDDIKLTYEYVLDHLNGYDVDYVEERNLVAQVDCDVKLTFKSPFMRHNLRTDIPVFLSLQENKVVLASSDYELFSDEIQRDALEEVYSTLHSKGYELEWNTENRTVVFQWLRRIFRGKFYRTITDPEIVEKTKELYHYLTRYENKWS